MASLGPLTLLPQMYYFFLRPFTVVSVREGRTENGTWVLHFLGSRAHLTPLGNLLDFTEVTLTFDSRPGGLWIMAVRGTAVEVVGPEGMEEEMWEPWISSDLVFGHFPL
jgi:hypothetical protein